MSACSVRIYVANRFISLPKQDFSHAFMINTVAEGHNSGRTYYLQASSHEQCQEMVKLIKTLSKRAIELAAAQTQFAKIQLRARKLYNSYLFQSGSAILIMVVGFMTVLPPLPILTSWCRISSSVSSSPNSAVK